MTRHGPRSVAALTASQALADHARASVMAVNTDGAPLQVIIFTGLPGTGKPTLAEHAARIVHVPAFAGDWLMGGLKPAHPALGQLDRSQYRAAWFGPPIDHLVADAMDPVPDNISRILAYVLAE